MEVLQNTSKPHLPLTGDHSMTATITDSSITDHSVSSSTNNIATDSFATTNANISNDVQQVKEEDVSQTNESLDESPEINVAINNVVCTFSTRCHLDLKTLALYGNNVELKKAQGMLNMKIRKPSATASIWSSGKITVTGANSEDNCKRAARRIARQIQKIGFDVKFSGFRIVNVLGTCSLPFGILLSEFSREFMGKVQYEPELHPGATYQIKDLKATLKVFSTGSITITAPRVENIQKAVENVFPMVYQFKKPKQYDPKEIEYMDELLNDSSEAELISDDSDLDLEPGELPSTKSRRFSDTKQKHPKTTRAINTAGRAKMSAIDEDTYGSGDDEASSSDESCN